MNLSGKRTAIADAVSWVARAAAKRPTEPMQAGVRLTAHAGGWLDVESFDFTRAHTARVSVVTDEPGAVIVSAAMAASVLDALRSGTVALSTDDDRLTITAGRSRYRLNRLGAPDDFPRMPSLILTPGGQVDADELRRIVGAVAYATNDDNPAHLLTTGIRLTDHGGKLTALGMRDSSMAVAWTEDGVGPFAVHLPVATLAESLRGLDGLVSIGADEGVLCLSTDHRQVTQRLYAWKPQPWERLIPTDCPTVVSMDVDALRGAVKRATLTGGPGAPVGFHASGPALTITAGTQDVADGEEVLDVEHAGPDVALTFGADILAGALAAIPAGPVTLSAVADGKPCTLTNPAGSFLLVLMPRRAAA